MNLPPRAGGMPPAPIQRKYSPAAARVGQEVETARWMDTVMRPDLHGRPVQQKSAAATPEPASPAATASNSGQPMPGDVQAKMESAFSTDFSAVRVHQGPQARGLGAHAYTQGTDIHFAPGRYDPSSQGGQELLGHELTHVVQQSRGQVQATTQTKGVGVNDDSSLEREADDMGARAARHQWGRGADSAASGASVHAAGSAPVQRSAHPVVQRVVDLDAWFAVKDKEGEKLSQVDDKKRAYLEQIQAFLADPEVGTYEGQLDAEIIKRMHEFYDEQDGTLSPNEAATKFLEEVLSDEEGLWMEPEKEVLPADSGQEKNKGFLKRIRTGKALVDKGAATSHGEYAHRMQWFMISRFFKDTNLETYIEEVDNKDASKSEMDVKNEAMENMHADLLELYKEMGKEEHVRRINKDDGKAEEPEDIDDDNLNLPLWSAILDVQGSHDRNKEEDPALEQFEGVRKAAPVNLTGDFTLNPVFERYDQEVGTLGFLAKPDSPISIALLDTRLKKWLKDGRKRDLALTKAIGKLGEGDKETVNGLLEDAKDGILDDTKRMKIIDIILRSKELGAIEKDKE